MIFGLLIAGGHSRFVVGMSFIVIVVAMLFSEDNALLPRRLAGLLVCMLLALEHAGVMFTYRTYKMSSLVFCAGLVGGQAFALLTRTQSSVEDLRTATEQLRRNCLLINCADEELLPEYLFPRVAEYLGYPLTNLPPFTVVGITLFNLGAVLGVLEIPLIYRLRIALLEITLFALCAVLVRVRTEQEDLLTLWAPPHACGLVLGLLLALLAKGELSTAHAPLRSSDQGQRGYLLPQKAKLKPPPRERDNRQARGLIAVLVAIMVYPLAYKLAVLESQGAPVYSLASVL